MNFDVTLQHKFKTYGLCASIVIHQIIHIESRRISMTIHTMTVSRITGIPMTTVIAIAIHIVTLTKAGKARGYIPIHANCSRA